MGPSAAERALARPKIGYILAYFHHKLTNNTSIPLIFSPGIQLYTFQDVSRPNRKVKFLKFSFWVWARLNGCYQYPRFLIFRVHKFIKFHLQMSWWYVRTKMNQFYLCWLDIAVVLNLWLGAYSNLGVTKDLQLCCSCNYHTSISLHHLLFLFDGKCDTSAAIITFPFGIFSLYPTEFSEF